MKKIATTSFIFLVLGFCSPVSIASAQSSPLAAKLPYEKGESFVVTQGYHSPPTHVGKDDFAIDFTQNGCEAYAKPAVAAVSGKAWVVEDAGYDGGYGTQLLILSGHDVVTRYAHLIPGSVGVKAGDEIAQGMPIGLIGNSGLVVGTACATHPGTHIHFAMDTENADGSFEALDPEPISGYSNVQEGKWYLSDNAAPADVSKDSGLTAIAVQSVGGTSSGNADENAQGISAGAATTSEPGVAESGTSSSQRFIVSSPADITPETVPTDDAGGGIASADGQAASSSDSLPSASQTGSSTLKTAEQPSSTQPITSSSGGGIGAVGTVVSPPIGGVVVMPPQAASQDASAAGGGAAVGSLSPSAESSSIATASSSENPHEDLAAASSSDAGTATSSPSAVAASSTVPEDDASSSDSVATSSVATSSSPSFTLDAPISMNGAAPLASFNSSTFAVDFAWQTPQNASGPGPVTYSVFLANASSSSSTFVASTTMNWFSYPIPDADSGGTDYFAVQATDGAGHQSALATTSIAVPNWFSAIQPDDGGESRPSWYSDNWYDLGAGFHGTLRSLTLEGFINSDLYGGSTVALQEFPDANYAAVDHTFPISPTPFAETPAKITVSGLKIPLSPEKYYRLTTVQAYQNRSVVLRGTDATGTAMWDNYVPGVGGVQYQYTFYPYLSAVIDPQEITIAPPSFLPGSVQISFDAANAKVSVSWPPAIDADEPLVSPTYQVNLSTSTALDPAGWQSENGSLSASFNVTFPNSYAIGVRALDDFGQPSAPITALWSFPAGYAPVPSQLDHSVMFSYGGGAQEIAFAATTTVSAVDFWTAPTSGMYCCSQSYLSVYNDNNGSRGAEIPSGNPVVTFGPYDTGGEESYPFASPMTLSPGSYWFVIAVGPSDSTNPTILYGSPNHGAYFRFVQATGP